MSIQDAAPRTRTLRTWIALMLVGILAPAIAIRFTPGLSLEQRRPWMLAGLVFSWFGYLAYLVVAALRPRDPTHRV